MDSTLVETKYPRPGQPDSPERRCEIRFRTAQSATVTALDGTAQPSDGCILDVSTRGLKLRSDWPLAVDTPVRIDVEADLILGEVRYCSSLECGWYELGIEVDQILSNAKEVAQRWVSRRWFTAA